MFASVPQVLLLQQPNEKSILMIEKHFAREQIEQRLASWIWSFFGGEGYFRFETLFSLEINSFSSFLSFLFL